MPRVRMLRKSAAIDAPISPAARRRTSAGSPQILHAYAPEPPEGTAVCSRTVTAPEPLRGRRYRNVFTGATLGGGEGLAAAAVFDRFPVALLVPAGGPDSDDQP